MSNCFDGNDDELLDVEFGDAKLMGFCSICNTTPCNAEGEYWGVCPICHRNDGYIDYVSGNHATHMMVCNSHKTCWPIGMNLFSGWMFESPETHQADREKLAEYETVKPYHGYFDQAADDRRQYEIDQADQFESKDSFVESATPVHEFETGNE